MRTWHNLKTPVFPRKTTSFLTSKWLFYEGFTKMSFFWVWEAVFETLGRGVFCEGIWRLFGKVISGRLGVNWLPILGGIPKPLRNLRSLCRRTAFTSLYVPSVVVPPPPAVGFSSHTPYPSIAGEALPWTKTPNNQYGSHSFSFIVTISWTKMTYNLPRWVAQAARANTPETKWPRTTCLGFKSHYPDNLYHLNT